MTRAQLAAMHEDWTQCGAWIEWLRDRNVRCIDHDVVYLPWTTTRGGVSAEEEEVVETEVAVVEKDYDTAASETEETKKNRPAGEESRS